MILIGEDRQAIFHLHLSKTSHSHRFSQAFMGFVAGRANQLKRADGFRWPIDERRHAPGLDPGIRSSGVPRGMPRSQGGVHAPPEKGAGRCRFCQRKNGTPVGGERVAFPPS